MVSRRQFMAAIASAAVSGRGLLAAAQGPAKAVRRVRGVNYIPSYAASPHETWSHYDGETIRRELAWAAGLGVDTVRITLSYEASREQPTPFEEALADFIGVVRENGLGLIPVLFDAWGVAPSADLGPGLESMAESYRRMAAHPDAYGLDEPGLRRFETAALELLPDRRVPRSGDPAVLLWGRWRPSPEPERMGPDFWPLFRHYVHRAVAVWRDNAAILAWDVMNNPELGRALRPKPNWEQAHRFVALAVDEVRAAGATQPLTVSFSGGYGSISPVVQQLDILSTQTMSGTGRDAQRAILEARSLSKGRAVWLTLGGGVLLPANRQEADDAYQAALVRQTLDAAEREEAGWLLWHLIEGEAFSPWAGLLRRDGTLKPAADLLRREMRPWR